MSVDLAQIDYREESGKLSKVGGAQARYAIRNRYAGQRKARLDQADMAILAKIKADLDPINAERAALDQSEGFAKNNFGEAMFLREKYRPMDAAAERLRAAREGAAMAGSES